VTPLVESCTLVPHKGYGMWLAAFTFSYGSASYEFYAILCSLDEPVTAARACLEDGKPQQLARQQFLEAVVLTTKH
jgi:hypothetical protein